MPGEVARRDRGPQQRTPVPQTEDSTMRHLAASIAMSLDLARDANADDRHRADAFRELHRRPDALPDPVEPVRPSRRWRVTGFAVRRRGSLPSEG
jgi:hypothetical protein